MSKAKRLWTWAPAAAASLVAMAAFAGPRFTRSEPEPGEPVVEDSVTGLVWQGCSAGQSGSDCQTGSAGTYTWQQALDYCDGLSWGGESDWDLPGAKELRSIVDNRNCSPAIDEAVFPQTASDYYWSSSVYAGYTGSAWHVAFVNGSVYYYGKDDDFRVRCVRRGP